MNFGCDGPEVNGFRLNFPYSWIATGPGNLVELVRLQACVCQGQYGGGAQPQVAPCAFDHDTQ